MFFCYSSQNARINLAWKDQTDLGNREDDKKIGAVNGGGHILRTSLPAKLYLCLRDYVLSSCADAHFDHMLRFGDFILEKAAIF